MAATSRGGRTWARGPNALSPTYRARLEAAGITRQKWLAGADLRQARAHPAPKTGRAPVAATERALAGDATPSDLRRIREWRTSREYPKWLPRDQFTLSDEAAASLANIGLAIDQWYPTRYIPAPEGKTGRLTVTPKRYVNKDGTVKTHAYDRTVEVPGGREGDELRQWLKEHGAKGTKENPNVYDNMGSDGKAKKRRLAQYDRRQRYEAMRRREGKPYTRRTKRK